MSEKRPYDSTVARIAGNIAAGLLSHPHAEGPFTAAGREEIAVTAIDIAKRIVVLLTPKQEEGIK